MALTLALVVLVAGGLALAVLAALVRGTTGVVRLDRSVAEWAHAHATPFSEHALKAFTAPRVPGRGRRAGGTARRRRDDRSRNRWIIPFLVVVVGGNAALTTTSSTWPTARGRRSTRSRPRSGRRSRAATRPTPRRSSPPPRSSSAGSAAAARAPASPGRPPGSRSAIAASRVLLDAHWLSDVLAGLALGWAWFAACSIAFGGRLLRFGAPAEVAQHAAAAPPRDRAAPGGRSATG